MSAEQVSAEELRSRHLPLPTLEEMVCKLADELETTRAERDQYKQQAEINAQLDISRGEGFAFFCWHCLRWPRQSSFPSCPCRFSKGCLCADMWTGGER